jgi:hypothetical protein
MKVKKEDLEQLTRQTAMAGTLALVLLTVTECPAKEVFEVMNDTLKRNEALRKELELKALIPDDLLSKFGDLFEISKLKAMLSAKAEQEAEKKSGIGFQMPSEVKNDLPN